MNTLEIISLIASIASLTLAIIAIWLSVIFYKLSSELSGKTIEASNNIGSSVERLENLFDKLYNDTFSMMRDTYSDIRKHMWPDQPLVDDASLKGIENKTDTKLNDLKKNLESELSKILENQKISNEKVPSLTEEMGKIFDQAIDNSHKVEVEAKGEKLRLIIHRMIVAWHNPRVPLTAGDIVDNIFRIYHILPEETINELTNMRKEGLISISDSVIKSNSEIWLNSHQKNGNKILGTGKSHGN